MPWPRYYPAYSSHPTLGLVITGGGSDNLALNSTVSTADGLSFVQDYPEFPYPILIPCQVTVGNKILVIGGGEADSPLSYNISSRVWELDLTSSSR